jgi:hypothetical protein
MAVNIYANTQTTVNRWWRTVAQCMYYKRHNDTGLMVEDLLALNYIVHNQNISKKSDSTQFPF